MIATFMETLVVSVPVKKCRVLIVKLLFDVPTKGFGFHLDWAFLFTVLLALCLKSKLSLFCFCQIIFDYGHCVKISSGNSSVSVYLNTVFKIAISPPELHHKTHNSEQDLY